MAGDDDGNNVKENDDDKEMDAKEAVGPESDAYEAFQAAMNWIWSLK